MGLLKDKKPTKGLEMKLQAIHFRINGNKKISPEF